MPVSIVTKSAVSTIASRSRNGWRALILSIFAPGNDSSGSADGFEFCGGAKLRNAFVGQQQSFGGSVARKFLDDVEFLWMDRDGEVRRQRPRRRRPDGDAGFVFPLAARDRKFHVNRGVVAFLIFHFSFGERGLRAGAPENRVSSIGKRDPFQRRPRTREGFRLRISDRASGKDFPNRRKRRAV